MVEAKLARMDRFEDHKWFTFTINPRDQNGKGNRWSIVRQRVIEYLRGNRMYIEDLKLYPDMSFPDTIGAGKFPRIHYHGKIKFKNIIGYLTAFKETEPYQIEIDTIEDKSEWKKYCKKFIEKHSEYTMYMIEYKCILEEEHLLNPNGSCNIIELAKKYIVD